MTITFSTINNIKNLIKTGEKEKFRETSTFENKN